MQTRQHIILHIQPALNCDGSLFQSCASLANGHLRFQAYLRRRVWILESNRLNLGLRDDICLPIKWLVGYA